MALAGWVFAAIGLFVMGSAIFDWNSFMTHPKARPITWLFGRNGARILYAVLGAIFRCHGDCGGRGTHRAA